MKTGISVTLDHSCVVWLNEQIGKKSRVVNKLIIEAMAGGSTRKSLRQEIVDLKDSVEFWYQESIRLAGQVKAAREAGLINMALEEIVEDLE